MLIGNFLFCSKLKNIISRSGNASFYLEKRASLPKQRLITMARNILKHSVFGAGGWCGSYHLLYCNGVSPIWDCMGKSPGSTTDTASSLMYTPGSSAGGSNSFILPPCGQPGWISWFLALAWHGPSQVAAVIWGINQYVEICFLSACFPPSQIMKKCVS